MKTVLPNTRVRFVSPFGSSEDSELPVKREDPPKREDKDKNNRYKNHSIIALSVFAVVISLIAVLLTGLQYSAVYYYVTPKYVSTSQPMTNYPYAFYIGGANVPLNLQIPNDLTTYVGKIFRVWAIDVGHMHTVTSGTATFDGSSKIATLGGAIGDGFVFEVISSNRIAIISATNVVFS